MEEMKVGERKWRREGESRIRWRKGGREDNSKEEIEERGVRGREVTHTVTLSHTQEYTHSPLLTLPH